MVLSLLAAASTFSALILVGYWMVRRPQIAAEGRLRALGAADQAARGGAYPSRVSMGSSEGGGRSSLLPAGLTRKMDERLAKAGTPLTAVAFYAIVLVSMLALPFAAYLLLFSVLGVGSKLIIGLPIFALFGAYLPYAWLRARVQSRQSQIRRELPDVLDLLTLCVESGLGLDAAFRRVSEETDGPLAGEISQMLHEVDLGKPRREALEELASRVSVAEVGVVVNSMIQSQQMGTSLAQTLRSQTQLMRMRRRQRAEQSARQASVKMAFPLVLFLMPSLFVVVLGPIAINLYQVLTD